MKQKLFYLFLFLSFQAQAQLGLQNLAVKKPRVPDTYTFAYTGAIQQFVVPNRVTSIQVAAIGARGGTGARGQVGGEGANITTSLNVTPGQILWVVVGGFPGMSATATYGFGGNGGSGTNFGGAGGGLSGVFTSSSPAIANALIVAGGGGGGSGIATGTNYTGGNAGNTSVGTSSNGNQPVDVNYLRNGKYQHGYAATNSAPGSAGEPFDAGTGGGNGSDLNGGSGGSNAGVSGWNGGGGGGAGFYGGGAGAGGGAATGGGAGGATKSSTNLNSYGAMNNTGNGSVSITCFSNSGLVLHLDAGNPASYSGSGSTTWNDLSGNGSNVTLSNTSFSSTNGGNIVFNGTASYADFTANIGTTNAITVEMWVKTNSLSSPVGMYFGFGLYDVWTNAGNIGYNTASSDQYGVVNSQVDYLGIVGSWRHLVFVMNTVTKTNNKIYVNGESQNLFQIAGTFSTTNSNFNSGLGRISSWSNDLNWRMNMNLANFKVYKRELTPQEITNNFNANKSRFFKEKDGLSPETASSSAYQIKQDYPNSTDGFYWIKNANINGGVPIKIYADMTTEGGGWTLILKNSSNAGWTYANSIARNTQNPFTTNADIINTATANYSIIGWADYIKKSESGFQYMFDASSRESFGGIWTANGNYSFLKTDNTQTNVTLAKKFGNWNYVSNNEGISQRMPWYSSTAGSGNGYLTLSTGNGYWWGTLVANNNNYSPSPYITDAGGGTINQNPGIIWYWVK